MDYRIRTMTAPEVAVAIEWAAQEGWNPGRHDATTFRAADPEGFLVATVDGEPAASISMVRYGPAFAFLGLYIALPQWRGQGCGWRLWQAAMAHAGQRQVGLDGVLAQQANYRKSGFRFAWRNVRHEGRGLPPQPLAPGVVPLAQVPFAAVESYDSAFFPAPRAAFLQAWIRQPGVATYAFVEDGELRGYGVLRPCRQGWKIGPLFADTEAIAEALYVALAGHAAPDAPVYLDLPEPNAAAVALARRHGMQMVFETARMYTGEVPQSPLARTWGITTFELG